MAGPRHGLGVLAATLAFAGLAASAEAVVITITAGTNAGTVVFDSGGFESPGYTAGTTPSTSSPTIGVYTLGTNPAGVKVLTGSTASGPSSAHSGSNYLTIDRSVSGGNSNTRIYAELATDIVLSQSSFTVEYALWQGSGSYSALGIGSDAAANATDYANLIASYGMDARTSPPFIHTYGLSGANPPPADFGTFAVGEWTNVTYAWNHVTSSATITAGANTYTLHKPTTSTATSVGRFIIQSNSTVPQYYDAIPEPASLALLAIGGVLLGGRSRQA